MKANYVLIDYENVQPSALAVLEKEHFKVLVFVGANQTRISFDLAAQLQRLGPKASYIKISGNGSNALDFHIAFYIGQIATTEPEAYFHIISKDAGFDPLVAHLKSKNIFACRSRDIHDIPIVKAANTRTLAEKLAVVTENLKQRGASKPRTVKTLSSTISSLFQKTLGDEELAQVLHQLQIDGLLEVNGTRVTYMLPN